VIDKLHRAIEVDSEYELFAEVERSFDESGRAIDSAPSSVKGDHALVR